MRSKQFLFLALILVGLVAAVVLLKRPPTPTKLAEEVGFKRVMPEAMEADAIQGIDLYQGEKKSDAVQLRRQGDRWVVASHHNAPVKTDKVSKLLDGVSGLEGEVRADNAEMLDAFKLQDQQALHVLLYTDKMDEPKAHLLAGKSSGQANFVRLADQDRVYSVNLNLRTEAGLYGDETDKALEAKPWLDLQIDDVPKDRVTRVDLMSPERELQLVQKKPEPEKPAAKEASESGEKPSEEKPAQVAATPEAKPETKPEWELVEPKVTFPLKQGVVEGLVSTLSSLRGDDVVAPDDLAKYGLDNPPYRAVLTVEEKDKEARQVAIAVGHTVSEEDEKRYARLEKDDSPVYLLPQWTFNQVFPTLGTILTLDVLSLSSDDIVRVSWEQDGQSLALERQPEDEAKPSSSSDKPSSSASDAPATEATSGEAQTAEAEAPKDEWRWVQTPNVDVDSDKLETLLNTVEHVTADDWFAETPADAGLDQPALVLHVTTKHGATHQVRFGQTRGKDEDRYVGVQGKEGTFVVAKTAYSSIADALKPLRPDAPPPAAAPERESMPKTDMSSTDPAVKPSSEGPTLDVSKQNASPEVPAMMKMPLETQPTTSPPASLSAPGTQATDKPTEGAPDTPPTDHQFPSPTKAQDTK
jgi:hypothetical protein